MGHPIFDVSTPLKPKAGLSGPPARGASALWITPLTRDKAPKGRLKIAPDEVLGGCRLDATVPQGTIEN